MVVKVGLNWWAVAAGVAVDMVGSFGVGMVAVLFALLVGVPVDPDQPEPAWLLAVGMVGGCAASALGGLVAAAIARTREIHHATVTGIVSLVLVLPLMVLMRPLATHPLWYDALTVLVVVPSAALGGWLFLAIPGARPPGRAAITRGDNARPG